MKESSTNIIYYDNACAYRNLLQEKQQNLKNESLKLKQVKTSAVPNCLLIQLTMLAVCKYERPPVHSIFMSVHCHYAAYVLSVLI